jgi:hypothetical protein
LTVTVETDDEITILEAASPGAEPSPIVAPTR